MRYAGVLEELDLDSRKELLNPLSWWREGVSAILLTPFYLLYQFGILATSPIGRIESASIFRLLAGLLSLVLSIVGLIGLIVDWPDFINLLPQWVLETAPFLRVDK